MKKFIAIILTLVVILSLCACSSTTETPAPTIPEVVDVANPMFVKVGDVVTIDGVEWNASMMFYNQNTEQIICNDNYSYFVVNRVNMHIFYVYATYGKSGVAYAFDTGLIYEGDIVVDGTNTIVPTN